MNGLTKAIKCAGTASKLAVLLGIKPMSVSRWKNRYQGVVPADRVLQIYGATGVTPHELRPDLYPNPAFHRRFFALLNLGFEYWEPTGGAISSNERKLVTGYAKFLSSYGGNESALLDAAEQYLEQIASRRVTNGISLCKSFDAYRAWVTVEAGHYDAIRLPDDTLRKQ